MLKMAYTNTDLVSAELKGQVISASTTPSTEQVERWIKEAKAEIEAKTGKVYEASGFSAEVYDYDGSGYFRYPKAPLISLDSVEYYDGTSWVSLTEGRDDDYLLYVNDAEVMFLSRTPQKGYQNLRVSGVYGYATTPVKIQLLATKMVAKRVIDATINSQAGEEGGSVRVGNISISDPGVFSANHSRTLKAEVDDLFRDLTSAGRGVVRLRRHYELRP